MQPIPEPELLDPSRTLTDDRDDMTVTEHRDRANMLASALKDSCTYAQQLWHQLDEVRGYLVRSLPDDPQLPNGSRTATAPTGPDDETGWADWRETFAATTSVLCGPHGDSGFGADVARSEERARRVAPVPVVPKDGPGDHIGRPQRPWWRFWGR